MFTYKPYLLMNDPNENSTEDSFYKIKTEIFQTHISSSSAENRIDQVPKTEKRIDLVADGIGTDPQHSKEISNENHELTKRYYGKDKFSSQPQGIAPQRIPIDALQYIADLEKQLKVAHENVGKLNNKNQELEESVNAERRNNCRLEERLSIEITEKKEQIETNLRLELKLHLEKEARKKEEQSRNILEEELRQQKEKNEKINEKCRDLQKSLKSNEIKFEVEVEMEVRKRCLKIDQEQTQCDVYKEVGSRELELKDIYQEVGLSELELKDAHQEIGLLKSIVDKKDQDIDAMKKQIEILKDVNNGYDLRIKEYKKERDADIASTLKLLYELKIMTRSPFERFRRRPTEKHKKIYQCIMALDKRMATHP